MAKDKSIIEKFTETMKGLADSAAEALKAEEPPKIGASAAGDMPLADPLPPVAAKPVRGRKRAAKKPARRGGARTAKRSARKSNKSNLAKPKNSANRSMPGRSRKSAAANRNATGVAGASRRRGTKRRANRTAQGSRR